MYVLQRQDLIARRANFFGIRKGTWYGEEMGLVGAAVESVKTFLGENSCVYLNVLLLCRSEEQSGTGGQRRYLGERYLRDSTDLETCWFFLMRSGAATGTFLAPRSVSPKLILLLIFLLRDFY